MTLFSYIWCGFCATLSIKSVPMHTKMLPLLLLLAVSGISVSAQVHVAPFVIHPLPVDWLSFRALPDGTVVDLDWTTTTDGALLPFYIQRSTDGQTWSDIGSVPALADKFAQVYAFRDSLPLNGISYYRIQRPLSVDTAQVSPVQPVHFSRPDVYRVNPNPVQGTLHLSLLSPSGGRLELKLFTNGGQQVRGQSWSVTPTETDLRLDVGGLGAGLYFLEIVDSRGVHPQKVLIL